MTSRARLFIASSTENLAVAYAIQEELDRELEVTVWSQGVFEPSRYTLDALEQVTRSSDLAIFIFSPDDVVTIRGDTKSAVRDNVIFELGLFVGALGRDRCIIAMPAGAEDLQLPSDLLGLGTSYYRVDRQDGNLRAALGPCCNAARRVAKTVTEATQDGPSNTENTVAVVELIEDDNDALSMIESWMGSRPCSDNTQAMRYDAVDSALGLARGMAKKHLPAAGRRWGYRIAREGRDTVLFIESSHGGY